MALSGVSFSDPLMRDDLRAYYDKMKSDAFAALDTRVETPGGKIRVPQADGSVREADALPVTNAQLKNAFVSFDQWLELQQDSYERYAARAEMPPRGADDGAAPEDIGYSYWEASTTKINAFLLSLQEVDAGATESVAKVADTKAYDFTDMTRQEIKEAGMELFRAGKITLDELFRFDHPDGRLLVGPDGGAVAYNPFEKMDFVGLLTQAMRDMEATGEANRADSGYSVFAGLVAKLEDWRQG